MVVKSSIVSHNRWKIPRESSRTFTNWKQKYLEKFLSTWKREKYISIRYYISARWCKQIKLASLDDVIKFLLINNSLFHYFLCFPSSLVPMWTHSPISLLSKCVWTESGCLFMVVLWTYLAIWKEGRLTAACSLPYPNPHLALSWGQWLEPLRLIHWTISSKGGTGDRLPQGQGQGRPPPNVVPFPHVAFLSMLESADQRQSQPGSFQIHP